MEKKNTKNQNVYYIIISVCPRPRNIQKDTETPITAHNMHIRGLAYALNLCVCVCVCAYTGANEAHRIAARTISRSRPCLRILHAITEAAQKTCGNWEFALSLWHFNHPHCCSGVMYTCRETYRYSML